MLPAMVVYFVNNYFLIPRLFFKEHKLWFIIINLALLLICNTYLFIGLFCGGVEDNNLILGMIALRQVHACGGESTQMV